MPCLLIYDHSKHTHTHTGKLIHLLTHTHTNNHSHTLSQSELLSTCNLANEHLRCDVIERTRTDNSAVCQCVCVCEVHSLKTPRNVMQRERGLSARAAPREHERQSAKETDRESACIKRRVECESASVLQWKCRCQQAQSKERSLQRAFTAAAARQQQ